MGGEKVDNTSSYFMDEKIIEMISQKETEQELKSEIKRISEEIQAGIVQIDGEQMEFIEKTLLNDRIRISIPKSFTLMPPDIASLKYPFEKKPNPIYMDETTTKNITFNYTDGDVTEEGIEEFKDSMLMVLERAFPNAMWLEDGVEEINGKNISFIEFISQALDISLYNFMFFAEINKIALICSINCSKDDMEAWKLLARGIMSSFREVPSIP